MFVVLALLAISFHPSFPKVSSWFSIVLLSMYLVSFAIGLGPVGYVLFAEISPSHLRAAGQSFALVVYDCASISIPPH